VRKTSTRRRRTDQSVNKVLLEGSVDSNISFQSIKTKNVMTIHLKSATSMSFRSFNNYKAAQIGWEGGSERLACLWRFDIYDSYVASVHNIELPDSKQGK
jgi:hypothetical protein